MSQRELILIFLFISLGSNLYTQQMNNQTSSSNQGLILLQQGKDYLDRAKRANENQIDSNLLTKALERFSASINYFITPIHDSQKAAAYAGLGEVYFWRNEYKRAKIEVQNSLSLDSNYKYALNISGILSHYDTNDTGAIRYFENVIRQDNSDLQANIFLQYIYKGRNNTQDLGRIEQNIQSITQHYLQSWIQLYKRGEYESIFNFIDNTFLLFKFHKDVKQYADELIKDIIDSFIHSFTDTLTISSYTRSNATFREFVKKILTQRNLEPEIVDISFNCIKLLPGTNKVKKELEKITNLNSKDYFENLLAEIYRTIQSIKPKITQIDTCNEILKQLNQLVNKDKYDRAIIEFEEKIKEHKNCINESSFVLPSKAKSIHHLNLAKVYLKFSDLLPDKLIYELKKISKDTTQNKVERLDSKFLLGLMYSRYEATRKKTDSLFVEVLTDSLYYDGIFFKEKDDEWAHYLLAKAYKIILDTLQIDKMKEKIIDKGIYHSSWSLKHTINKELERESRILRKKLEKILRKKTFFRYFPYVVGILVIFIIVYARRMNSNYNKYRKSIRENCLDIINNISNSNTNHFNPQSVFVSLSKFEDNLEKKLEKKLNLKVKFDIKSMRSHIKLAKLKSDLKSNIFKEPVVLCFEKLILAAIKGGKKVELIPQNYNKWEVTYIFNNYKTIYSIDLYNSDLYNIIEIILESCGCKCEWINNDLSISIPWPQTDYIKFIIKIRDKLLGHNKI